MATATLPLIPNNVYRIRSGNPSNANAYLERQADGSVTIQPSNPSSDSQQWTISSAADGDYRITSVSNPSEGILHVNDINELECGTARRPTWNIESRGRDTYVIGYAANALAISLPRQNQPVAVSPRNNRVNQRWILDPNPLQSASIPGTVAANPRYTGGTKGEINVRNNLRVPVYVAVSSSGPGYLGNQRFVDAGESISWTRVTSEMVHVSMGTGWGSSRTYNGVVGSTLHIDSPISDSQWNGITSVPMTNVRYEPGTEGQIRVQNDLSFSIYVAVMNSAWADPSLRPQTVIGSFLGLVVSPMILSRAHQLYTSQEAIRPRGSDAWSRRSSEIVLVGMASTPGFVRAYAGQLGRTLIIESPDGKSLP